MSGIARREVPVALVARGVICALGRGEEALWRGLLAGESGFRPGDLDGREVLAARVPEAALPAGEGDRVLWLVREAARQLRESPAWRDIRPERLGVAVGTTVGPILSWQRHQSRRRDPGHRPPAPTLGEPALAVAQLLGARGPVQTPSLACASGTAAVGLGLDWIRRGWCEAVVAGGVDTLSRFVHAGFLALRALDPERPRPFDRRRAGLGLGEGAALLLLRAGGPGGTLITGHGLSTDANHMTGPDPSGQGLARAIGAALDDGGVPAEAVGFVNAHGTGTTFNDLMESKALALVFGERVGALPVNSIKGAVGHTLGAAGAIEAIVAALALERGQIPPTAGLEELDPALGLDVVQGAPRSVALRHVLSTSSGFGGVNAALLLSRAS